MKDNRLSKLLRLSLAAAAVVAFTQPSSAQQVLYSENFETDVAANWNINAPSARDTADFGFDYSTVGIPAAPGATTTRGLRLGANRPIGGTAARTGVSVSPKDQSFTGSYVMEFDMWANFPGPAPAGGAGSTQLTGGGILTSGTVPNHDTAAASPIGDAIWFAVTGESGATLDFRAYFNGINQTDPSLYQAGGLGHELAYYQTNFPGGVSAPAAQVAAFPSQTGQTGNGSVGWKWRHVTITKDGDIVTWDIDNVRISTVDLVANGVATGGNNILLAHSDINATATTAALDPVHFGLIDNLRVTTLATKVTATLSDPSGNPIESLSESDVATVSGFRIARQSADLTAPMDVSFNLAGTATRGDDYILRVNGTTVTANTVTIPAGNDTVQVEIVAVDDNVAEVAETIIFNIVSGPSYVAFSPTGGTIGLSDNEQPSVDISAVVFPFMFEGNTNDLIRVTLQRRGDLNAGPFDVNVAYAGTATAGSDFTPAATATFNPGDLTVSVDIHPLNDTATEPRETVIVSVATGSGYTVGTNNVLTAGATGVILDDDLPEGTIFFEDDFTPESAANWTVLFGSVNPDSQDFTANFGIDYTNPEGLNIPASPHASGETLGLLMSVNKLDTLLEAAGVNAYANGQDFSGNYAVRFDMYLVQNTTAGTTENAIFGLNHSGSKTNWYSNSAGGVPAGWEFDGIWASVVTDGSLLSGDPRARAYQLFAGAGTTLGVLFGPDLVAGREASALVDVFHRPPWSSGSGAGSPGNSTTTTTPSWAQVELRHENGAVTLSINSTNILTYNNTTNANHGTIMLGYDDAYNSIGSGGGGFVVYDNLRVVRLDGGTTPEVRISTLTRTGNNIEINFTAGAGEPTTAFRLYSSPTVTGPYTEDTTASITSQGGSNYRVTTTATDTMRFYQIRRATP